MHDFDALTFVGQIWRFAEDGSIEYPPCCPRESTEWTVGSGVLDVHPIAERDAGGIRLFLHQMLDTPERGSRTEVELVWFSQQGIDRSYELNSVIQLDARLDARLSIDCETDSAAPAVALLDDKGGDIIRAWEADTAAIRFHNVPPSTVECS